VPQQVPAALAEGALPQQRWETQVQTRTRVVLRAARRLALRGPPGGQGQLQALRQARYRLRRLVARRQQRRTPLMGRRRLRWGWRGCRAAEGRAEAWGGRRQPLGPESQGERGPPLAQLQ
jgi:hypothetical protein